MVNVDYLHVLIGLSLDVAVGQKVALVSWMNVDYLHVLIGLSLDVAMGQTVALVSW